MKWLLLALMPTLVFAKVKTEKISYEVNGVKMQGVLAYNDKVKKPAPGIVVFPDWMGVGAYSEMRATQLAEMGYVAFAADVHGIDGRPKDQKQAGEMAGKLRDDRQVMRDRGQGALAVLINDKRVDTSKLAAIGYCFGGSMSLELARAGAKIKGIVSFHGGLGTNMKGTKFDQKLLILHGADDPFVPEKEVSEFQEELRAAKADWQFISYSNAVHAFTQKDAGNDNSKGAAYNEVADKRSWKHMELFFKEIF